MGEPGAMRYLTRSGSECERIILGKYMVPAV
jgi:hypothetical protein